jgi:hypothetical protein
MNKILLILLFTMNICYGQKVLYILHPVVGDTIDKTEKKKYYLFEEIKDPSFLYCTIHKDNKKYFLEVDYSDDSVSTWEISEESLKKYHDNIDKLIEYYYIQSKKDLSHERVYHPTVDSISLNKNYVAPNLTELQMNEIERDQRLKSDAERMNLYKQGLETSPGYIQIYKSKSKK